MAVSLLVLFSSRQVGNKVGTVLRNYLFVDTGILHGRFRLVLI